MKKSGVLEITFLIVLMGCMIFSKNILLRIISGAILLVWVITFKIMNYLKRKRLINQIKDNNKTLILCKQNSYIFLLTGITFIMNATSNINSIVHGKNMDMFLNEGIELNGFIDFINRSSINEKVDIFIYGMLIILGIVFILEWLSSFAIISDDKIVFNNGNVFNFSEITDIKYREALFSKRKIIKLIKNGYEEEIIIKVEDFEKVSEYLETHISM